MPPYPMLDASVSTIMNAEGLGMPRHGSDFTFSLICQTILVCSFVKGTGFFLSLLYKGAQTWCKFGKKSET